MKSSVDFAAEHLLESLQSGRLASGPAATDYGEAPLTSLDRLGLRTAVAEPIFQEAVQTSAQLLETPICILSVIDEQFQIFQAALGLSHLGLMNPLAAERRIPREESFGLQVVKRQRYLIVNDVAQHPQLHLSPLHHHYGIQSYLGTPLFTADGVCIGTLEVMDTAQRTFSQKDLTLLELNARWAMSEYEKRQLLTAYSGSFATDERTTSGKGHGPDPQSHVKGLQLKVITALVQELHSPLTAISGMANMLSREIYGPLTHKQQEYARVVLKSSRKLLALTERITDLGDLPSIPQAPALAPTDIEMVVQQSLQQAEAIVCHRKLAVKLTLEPGSRIWQLDRDIIKQLVYQLTMSLGDSSLEDSTIRLHISHKEDRLLLTLWTANPWLGDSLPQDIVRWCRRVGLLASHRPLESLSQRELPQDSSRLPISLPAGEQALRCELGMVLSYRLVQAHGGAVSVQGSAGRGYRYIVKIPSMQHS